MRLVRHTCNGPLCFWFKHRPRLYKCYFLTQSFSMSPLHILERLYDGFLLIWGSLLEIHWRKRTQCVFDSSDFETSDSVTFGNPSERWSQDPCVLDVGLSVHCMSNRNVYLVLLLSLFRFALDRVLELHCTMRQGSCVYSCVLTVGAHVSGISRVSVRGFQCWVFVSMFRWAPTSNKTLISAYSIFTLCVRASLECSLCLWVRWFRSFFMIFTVFWNSSVWRDPDPPCIRMSWLGLHFLDLNLIPGRGFLCCWCDLRCRAQETNKAGPQCVFLCFEWCMFPVKSVALQLLLICMTCCNLSENPAIQGI